MHGISEEQGGEQGSPERSAAVRSWGLALALFVFALLVRGLPIHDVIVNKHVLFIGNDAYYHMRRVLYSLVNFPAYLEFDRYINFPAGARPIWSPFFDWALAGALLPLRATSGIAAVEQIAIWVPPLLGALTVVALYRGARRFYGETVAGVAGLLLSVMSAHFWYSQIGFLDHHCAVALVTTLLLFSAMAFVDQLDGSDRIDRCESGDPALSIRGIRAAVGLGAGLGVTLLVWPGALLHVGLVELGLLVFLLGRADRATASSVGQRLTLAHASAALLVSPFALGSEWPQWSDFSPVVLSNFQPWYFAAATLFSAACGWGWRGIDALGATRPRRIATALATMGILVGSSLVLWPALTDGVREVWGWFSKTDDFQGLVAESAPLFIVKDAFSLHVAVGRFSALVVLAPVFFAAAAWLLRARGGGVANWLFLWWAFALSVTTVFQKRFMNSSSVAFSLLVAIVLVFGATWLSERFARERRSRMAICAAVGIFAIALVSPMLTTYSRYAANVYLRLEGRPTGTTSLVLHKLAIVKTARWVRHHTPETEGWIDSAKQPEYAVMAPWGLGHVIEYEARRPTINDNFGDDIGAENFLRAREYYLSEEEAGAKILEFLRARYVVAQQSGSYLGETGDRGSLFNALYMRDGSALIRDDEGATEDLPALRRHRLIHESRPVSFATLGDAGFKVFEFVPGARIVGRAAAGATIDLLLRLETNRGRKLDYRVRTRATGEGRYALHVPYSTGAGREEDVETVRTGDYYFVSCGEESRGMTISETAIRSGSTLRGPDMCEDASGG